MTYGWCGDVESILMSPHHLFVYIFGIRMIACDNKEEAMATDDIVRDDLRDICVGFWR